MRTIQNYLTKSFLVITTFFLSTNFTYATCSSGFTLHSVESWTAGRTGESDLVKSTGIVVSPNTEITLEDVRTEDGGSTEQPHEQFKAVLSSVAESGYTTDIDNNNPGVVYTDLGSLVNTSGGDIELTFRHYAADHDTTGGPADGYNSVTLHDFCYKVTPVASCDAGYTFLPLDIYTAGYSSDTDLVQNINLTFDATADSIDFKDVWTHNEDTNLQDHEQFLIEAYTTSTGVSTGTTIYTTDVDNSLPHTDQFSDIGSLNIDNTMSIRARHWAADHAAPSGPNSVSLKGLCYKITSNSAPTAVPDTKTTAEDTATTITVLGNDTDPDGDTLSVTTVTQPSNGTVVKNANGTITYTPDANYHGTDTFTYSITDGNGGTDTTTVTVTVTPGNDAPTAVNDTKTTPEDTATTITVLGNDTDPDGDALSVTTVTQPSNGTTVKNANGTITYTPDANFNGTDVFTYSISDGNGGTDTTTVTVTVTPVNDAPVAVDDISSTLEDTPVDIPVVSNDTDVDGDTLTVKPGSLTAPANGTVVINPNGTVKYTPVANFNGTDTFEYTVQDGNGGEDTATVTVTVGSVNAAPTAVPDTKTTAEDTATTITVLGNDTDPDGDALSVTTVTQPSNGTTVKNANGTITYTPDANFNGTDVFTYSITDGNGGTDTTTVTVTVTPVNDAPVAVDDISSTLEDTPVDIPVVSNDTDVDGDTLTVKTGSLTTPANGTVVINPNGTVKYTPVANFNGTDTFEYTVQDGNGGEDTATVTVTVGSVNDAPTAVPDTKTTAEDTATTITVLGNDTDPDGDALSVTTVTQPSNGTTVKNANGTITYTPDANFNGTDVFTYSITDGNGGTDTTTVTVTVTPVNDAPVAVDDISSTLEDTPVDIPVVSNDTDVDGDTLTVKTGSLTTPANGTVVINPNGTVKYTPVANFNGTDTFEYTVQDGNGGEDTATVTVTVGSVNDRVIAVDDYETTDEEVAVDINVSNNDIDDDGDTLTVDSFTQPNNGTVTQNANGTLKYIPDANFDGVDFFTYVITDGSTNDSAFVVITVNDTNKKPIAIDDNKTTLEDTPTIITVLGNDTDPDGDTLTVKPGSLTTPANGTVVINPDGTVTYTPDANFTGTDTFEYTVQDGNGGEDPATVTVTVTPVNDAPVAVDDNESTPEDTPIDINVTMNDIDVDGDILIVDVFTQPTHGTVTQNADGTLKYTPDANFNGIDTFEYNVTDGVLTDTATVTVTVTPVNDAPVAVDDTNQTDKNTSITLGLEDIVLSNDSDVDGDTLSIISVSNEVNGSVILNGDGTVTFTPDINYTGTGQFDYTISDGNGGFDTATVVITINETVFPPDYRPILTVYGGIVAGAGEHVISFDILVRDLIDNGQYDQSNPLVVRVPKNDAITLVYDNTMTSFKGQFVENDLWLFDDSDPFDYVLTFTGISDHLSRTRFAIEGTFIVEEGEIGKFILEATIKAGTGGDSNIDNNSDRDTIEKRLN